MVEPIEHEKYSLSGSSDKPPYENPVNKTYLNKMLIEIKSISSTHKWKDKSILDLPSERKLQYKQ